MATTSVSLDITSDITPNLSISANIENLTKTGTSTGLELVDMGHGQLTQTLYKKHWAQLIRLTMFTFATVLLTLSNT